MKTPLKQILANKNITATSLSLEIGKYNKFITKRLSINSEVSFKDEDKKLIANALGMKVSEIDFSKCDPKAQPIKQKRNVYKIPLEQAANKQGHSLLSLSKLIGKNHAYLTHCLNANRPDVIPDDLKRVIAKELGMHVYDLDFSKRQPRVHGFEISQRATNENAELKHKLVEAEAQLHEMKVKLVKANFSTEDERLKDEVYRLTNENSILKSKYETSNQQHTDLVTRLIRANDELQRSKQQIAELQNRSFIKRVFKVGVK